MSAIAEAASIPHPGRLRWHSRRALLELDLVLERFWQRHGDTLETNQAQLLEQLLKLEDHDLWDVFCGRQNIGDPQLEAMLELLRRV